MQKKIKSIAVTGTFILFLAFFSVICITRYFHPGEISESERRPLAQFPEKITWAGIIDKTVIDEFEEYSVDQFPFREFFRSLKANFQLKVMRLGEYNGLAIKDGYIAKIEQAFTPELVEYSLGLLQYIYEKFLADNGGKKYVSVIPDKNYFFAKDYGYLSPDYDRLVADVKEKLSGMEYVDVFDALKLSDYYRTDTHWSQDRIGNVVDKLAQAMGCADRLTGEYTKHQYEPFYGVYYGQSAIHPKPDTITYLTNSILEQCTVFDYETGETRGIYDFEKLEGKDGYEFFLSGTKALLRVDNPNATTEDELIIFRDSFGSSISPLLVEGYKSVYLVDIRYVVPDLLNRLIDFENKDVLYLYSALVLNSKSFK